MDASRQPRLDTKRVAASHWVGASLVVLLILASAVQFAIVSRDYAYPWLLKIWELRGEDSWDRAAFLSPWNSERDARYLEFLRREIPSHAWVVIPPSHSRYFPIQLIAYMSYALFPRQVIQCIPLDGECAKGHGQEPVYVLVISDFPDQEALERVVSQRVMLDRERGVLKLDTGTEEGQ